MSYFPDTAQGLAADTLPQAGVLGAANILVLRQGTSDVQTTLGALQSFLGGVAAPGVPGAPVQGSTTTTSIALSWAAPAAGGAVASYVLQQSATGANSWATVAAPGSAAAGVTGLSAATGYDFRVAAVNAGGTSAYSAVLVNAMTAAAGAPPNGVTGLSMTVATSSTIALTWAETGGAPTVRTVTQRTPAGSGPYSAASGTFGATGGTVTGLAAGTSYDFQVVESNAAGSSATATLSNVATTVAAPGGVTGLAVASLSASAAVLGWTNAPTATGWTVMQRSPAGAGSFVASALSVAASATGATVTGLAGGQSYDFQVLASNAGGIGPAAVLSGVTTVPGTVTSLVASTIGATSVVLSWGNPAGATGWAVTQRTPSGAGAYGAAVLSVAATASGATVSGLTTGSSYDFQVVASNASGSGAAAALTNITPLAVAAVPGQVTGVVLGTPTSTVMPMSWAAPAGGGAPTGFKVELSSDGGSSWGTPLVVGSWDTYYVATGLTAATSYIARVTATNAGGSGATSVNSGAVSTLAASANYATVVAPAAGTVGTLISGVTYTSNLSGGYAVAALAGADYTGSSSAQRSLTAFTPPGGTLPGVVLPVAGTWTIRLYNGGNTTLLAESRPIVVTGVAATQDYAVTSGSTGYTVSITPPLPASLPANGRRDYFQIRIKNTATGVAQTATIYAYWGSSSAPGASAIAGPFNSADNSFRTVFDTVLAANKGATKYLWLTIGANTVLVDGTGILVP